MSNRTLMEFNHDLAVKILHAPKEFAITMVRYLRSGDAEDAEDLERFGVTVGPMRHHSDPDPLEGKKRSASLSEPLP